MIKKRPKKIIQGAMIVVVAPFERLRELKQQTNEWFSSVCKTISEQILVIKTFNL